MATTRAALPYGAVMATGGAAQLAASSGLHPLAVPLLWLTVAEAVALPLVGTLRRGSLGAGLRALSGSAAPGDFTVPVGLAVIGSGLAKLETGPVIYGASVALTLAWVSTIVLMVRVVLAVAARRAGIEPVNGAWFLVPASLLADAVGTATIAQRPTTWGRVGLGWLALVGCGIGVATYLVVVGLAAWRVGRLGTRGTERAPWWVSAGCGGLAAASVGQVARAVQPEVTGVHTHWFAAVAMVVWVVGSALMVPVLAGSLSFLLHLRHLQGSPPWPPTFSTGVYALGTGQVGRLWHLQLISDLGRGAGLATVLLWLATAALHLAFFARRLRPQEQLG